MASLAEQTAANKAAGPTKPGQVWYNQQDPLRGRDKGSSSATPQGQLAAANGVAGFWGDPSLQNQRGFLSQVMQGVGDSMPTWVPLAMAAGTGYGLYNSGMLGGAAGAASSVAPEVAAGIAPEVAAGIAPEVAAGIAPEVAAGIAPEVATGAAYTGAGLTAGSGTTGLTAGGLSGLGSASTLGSPIAADVAANTLGSSLGATGLMGAGAAAAGAGGSTLANSLIPGISNGSLLTTGLNTLGGLIQGQTATDAAQTQADAQIRAAQIAADAAKFKPVGVTTGFGSSQFGFDANGNLTSAGYNLTPEMKAQRDALIAQSTGLLGQAGGAQAATAPMGQAAQTMMGLGQGYLATSPQAQAQKYLNDQLGLLSPQRASDMAALQAQMQAQGRGGFAIGGGVNGQGAANPQLQALYNAQMQQDAQLAANATQGGMDYAKFGADMVGSGGNMLSSMYGVQNAAYDPYNTALDAANTVEGLGQNAMTLGTNLGNTATAASAASGNALARGMNNAADTMAPANAYSPWANLLSGTGKMLSQYQFGQ